MSTEKKKGDTRNKFSPAEKEWLMREIADRAFKNFYQSQIAEDINAMLKEKDSDKRITQRLVSYYLNKLKERWKEDAAEKIDDAKARELAKINNLEREYWKAWLRSLGPVKVKKAKKSLEKGSIENSEYDSLGDPRYLEGIRNCMKARRELWGLDAPKRFQQDGILIMIDDWTKLSTEQVDALRRGENPINVLRPDQYRTESKK